MSTDPVAGGISPVVAGVAGGPRGAGSGSPWAAGEPQGAAEMGIAGVSDQAGDDVAAAHADDAKSLEVLERKWKIHALRADVARTFAISIVGAMIAGIFYVFQDSQTRSRYYSDLQAHRESADSALRAQMFTTLFQNYLKAKLESTQRAQQSKAGAQELTDAQLTDLQQEIVMSDLLARNFEAVDVRPMFEDIDRRLTDRIEAGRTGQDAIADQRRAFSLREQLRRVAGGAATRQTAALIARVEGARSEQLRIEQCKTEGESRAVVHPSLLSSVGSGADAVIESVNADAVNMSILNGVNGGAPAASGVIAEPQRVRFAVTFYDMPALESVRLPQGERLALTMTRFLSAGICERFYNELDEATRTDCELVMADKYDRHRDCSRVDITLTTLPASYIGIRDRPYFNELTSSARSGASLFGSAGR